MSQKDFAHRVVPTGILPSDEALEVHQFLSGVTPATEMKFSCTKREGILSKSAVLRCRQYPSSMGILTSLERFNELTGSLTFQTDRDIYFRGVCLYARASKGQNIRAVVRVLTGEENGAELEAEEGIFTMESISTGSGFDVLFEFPVQVRALSKYIIHATVQDINGAMKRFYLDSPLSAVNCAGVNVTFEGESELISGLLFHTVN